MHILMLIKLIKQTPASKDNFYEAFWRIQYQALHKSIESTGSHELIVMAYQHDIHVYHLLSG